MDVSNILKKVSALKYLLCKVPIWKTFAHVMPVDEKQEEVEEDAMPVTGGASVSVCLHMCVSVSASASMLPCSRFSKVSALVHLQQKTIYRVL